MRTVLTCLSLLLAASPVAAQPVGVDSPGPRVSAPASHVPPSPPLEDERDPITAPRLTVAGSFTPVGDVDTTADVGGVRVVDQKLQGDLGFGGAVWLDVPLATFFSVGVGGGVLSWTTDEESSSGFDRSTLLTLSAHASLRLPLSELFEVYFRFPFGLSLDVAPGDWVDGGDLSPLPGWHAGGLLGTYLGGTRFGVTFELGVVVHGLRSRIEPDGLGQDGRFERTVKSVPMNLGMVWLF